MPLDGTNFSYRVLTADEQHDLDVLRAARHLIHKPQRWHKGALPQFRLWGKTYCAMTAVMAHSRHFVSEPERHLLRQMPPGYRCVAEYNDAPETTHADILALFDRAIAAVGQA